MKNYQYMSGLKYFYIVFAILIVIYWCAAYALGSNIYDIENFYAIHGTITLINELVAFGLVIYYYGLKKSFLSKMFVLAYFVYYMHSTYWLAIFRERIKNNDPFFRDSSLYDAHHIIAIMLPILAAYLFYRLYREHTQEMRLSTGVDKTV